MAKIVTFIHEDDVLPELYLLCLRVMSTTRPKRRMCSDFLTIIHRRKFSDMKVI